MKVFLFCSVLLFGSVCLFTSDAVEAQQSDPAKRAQWKAKVKAIIKNQTAAISPRGKTAPADPVTADCIEEALTNGVLDSEVFWKDPEASLKRMTIDSEAEYARLSVSADAVATHSVTCALSSAIPVQDVPDLILDYADLKRKNEPVQVKGFFRAVGELNYLFERRGSTLFVMIDTTALSRDARKKLLRECSRGCSLTVIGAVRDVMNNKGIAAILVH